MASHPEVAESTADPDATTTADRPARTRKRFRYTIPGLSVALIFACLAFTPSLLPRDGLVQGVICGVSAAIGYALGVLGAWVWRAFADRDERRASRRTWLIFAVVAVVALVVSWLLGRRWQGQIRDLMGVEPGSVFSQILLPFVAALLFVVLVATSRLIWRLYQWVAGQLNRWMGERAAKAVGWAVVVAGVYLVASGLLFQNVSEAVNQSFSVRNDITKDGVTRPTSDLRSGGPESLVSWDSLGREGRSFVSGGPTATEISSFSGKPATEPIRAFAGLETEEETEDRAARAVQDLERAGGFERDYLMVATTTGSGWISPGAADSFEYMTNGSSAIVGIQYSYLPSWISYLVDQKKAREAGRDLYDAVYEKWSKMPIDDRPKLIVFGESLGTFGGEAAFSGEADLANRTDGALFTGPPNFNVLYREFTDGRDAGTPEIEPVYRHGRIVRFDGDADAAIPPAGQPWTRSRVLYVQHASDPIVWWSPNLIFNKPDWLDEARGPDVVDEMRWFPIVTFWQVTLDLPGATAVPGGHGHRYTPNYVDSWARVLHPAGWTGDKRDELQAIIAPDSTNE